MLASTSTGTVRFERGLAAERFGALQTGELPFFGPGVAALHASGILGNGAEVHAVPTVSVARAKTQGVRERKGAFRRRKMRAVRIRDSGVVSLGGRFHAREKRRCVLYGPRPGVPEVEFAEFGLKVPLVGKSRRRIFRRDGGDLRGILQNRFHRALRKVGGARSAAAPSFPDGYGENRLVRVLDRFDVTPVRCDRETFVNAHFSTRLVRAELLRALDRPTGELCGGLKGSVRRRESGIRHD